MSWHAGDLALAGAFLAMYFRGLVPRYRAWSAFLLLQLTRDIALAALPFQTMLYAYSFMVTELIADVVLAMAMYEWFQLLAEHYPGIKMAGTWFLHVGLGISFLLCLTTLGRDWQMMDWENPSLPMVLLVKRVVVGVLGVFVVLVFAAFLLYRVRVRPNVIWHGLLLMSYLWLQSILSIVDGWSGLAKGKVDTTNEIRAVATVFVYSGWFLLMTRRGETVEFADRLSDDERLQLDRINEELLNLVRPTVRQT
jgi:hypothetical protein